MKVTFEKYFNGKFIGDRDLNQFYEIMSVTVVRIFSKVETKDSRENDNNEDVVDAKDADIEREQVFSVEKDEDFSLGTGVVIGNGLILTAAHLVKDSLELAYCHLDDTCYWKVDILAVDYAIGLALIRRKSSYGRNKCAVLANVNDVKVGQQALTIAHSGTYDCSFTLGNVAYPARFFLPTNIEGFSHLQSEEVGKGYSHIQINNLHASNGSSGGPVFNNIGLVIGILVFEENGFDFAVHINEVRNFLEKAGSKDTD